MSNAKSRLKETPLNKYIVKPAQEQKVILGLRWALSDRLFDRVWGKVMGIPATVGSRQ